MRGARLSFVPESGPIRADEMQAEQGAKEGAV